MKPAGRAAGPPAATLTPGDFASPEPPRRAALRSPRSPREAEKSNAVFHANPVFLDINSAKLRTTRDPATIYAKLPFVTISHQTQGKHGIFAKNSIDIHCYLPGR